MTFYTPEEQKAHRQLWVEALRSGKYQQGRHTLRDATGAMCCLGVACEISGLGSWVDSETYEAAEYRSYMGLVPAVREWLGLHAGRTDYAEGEFSGAENYAPGKIGLSDINDSGIPFSIIADIIEAEPDGLIVKAEAA